MQTNFDEKKAFYQNPSVEIVILNIDVITASKDPYVEDEYGNLFD